MMASGSAVQTNGLGDRRSRVSRHSIERRDSGLTETGLSRARSELHSRATAGFVNLQIA